jgi:hypothetical protein
MWIKYAAGRVAARRNPLQLYREPAMIERIIHQAQNPERTGKTTRARSPEAARRVFSRIMDVLLCDIINISF